MYDKEIGMYYLIARYYNPEHGVFLSVDPDPGDEDDPITMNGYTYGDNNPVMKIDPDGHVAWWIAGALGGAAWDVGTYLWNNRKRVFLERSREISTKRSGGRSCTRWSWKSWLFRSKIKI